MNSQKQTRRNFIKNTAGIAAFGFSVPVIWKTSNAQAKNDVLVGAAIGTGSRGSGIGRTAGKFNKMAACCDVDRQHAEQFVSKFDNGMKIYEDYRKVLERKDIDFVTIGTPDHWHTAIAIAAMKAGKDVYCEKPLTLTIDEGKLICKVAKETGRVFQVGTQQRSEFKSQFLKAIAMTRNGWLGKNITATCSIGGGPSGGPFEVSSPPAPLNWDFWLGQAPKVPYCEERCHRKFRYWYEYSGGTITDWGAHHIDIAQWALGYENSGPIQIAGKGNLPNVPNGYNTATKFDLTLTFKNNTKLIVRNNPGNGIGLKGEKGGIFVSRSEIKGSIIDEMTQTDKDRLNEQVLALYKGKNPGDHMKNFFDCIRDRSQPISDVFTHHRSMTSCHLCNIAVRLNKKLYWDPKSEEFVGDPEASAMLSREQRKPYVIEA